MLCARVCSIFFNLSIFLIVVKTLYFQQIAEAKKDLGKKGVKLSWS